MLLLRQSLALVAAPLLLLLPMPPPSLRALLALVLMPVLMPVLVPVLMPVLMPVLFLHQIGTFSSKLSVGTSCAWLPIGRPPFWT
jgi:hypothetical protein